MEDENGVIINIENHISSTEILEPSHREKQALVRSVRSKVLRSSFSMEDEKPEKKNKMKYASDFYRKLKKRMKYR